LINIVETIIWSNWKLNEKSRNWSIDNC